MMDLELLNFLIHDLHLYVKGSELFVRFSSCSADGMRSCLFKLSDNKKMILDFFGYNTEVEYDLLQQRDLYVFLCDSRKIDITKIYLHLSSFKGGGPSLKNDVFSGFDRYLKDQYYNRHNKPSSYHERHIWFNNAIQFFGKEKEYQRFKEKRKMLDTIFEKGECLKSKGENPLFIRFIIVYGIQTLANMNAAEMEKEWATFKQQDWGLLNFIYRSDYP